MFSNYRQSFLFKNLIGARKLVPWVLEDLWVPEGLGSQYSKKNRKLPGNWQNTWEQYLTLRKRQKKIDWKLSTKPRLKIAENCQPSFSHVRNYWNLNNWQNLIDEFQRNWQKKKLAEAENWQIIQITGKIPPEIFLN